MESREIHIIRNKEDSYGYRSYSFPSFRYLLDFDDDESVFCLGLRIDGQPAGLALGQVNAESELHLLSIYTARDFRRQGNAQYLLEQWLELARQTEHSQVYVTYMTEKKSTPAVTALLRNADFEEPQLRNLVIQCSLESAATISWLQACDMPGNYQIVPWSMVSEQQKQELVLSDQAEGWIDPELEPSLYEEDLEPLSSTALLVDGRIRAWCLNHLVEDILRFSCSFAHPKLQRLGRITHLYHYAYSAMPAIGVNVGMWIVSVQRPRMFKFAQRYMIPNASFHAQTMGACKKLGSTDTTNDQTISI